MQGVISGIVSAGQASWGDVSYLSDPEGAHVTTIPMQPLDQLSPALPTALDVAADRLIDRSEVSCPHCADETATQVPVFVGQDGAYDRVDFLCGQCGTEHPIWFD